MLGAAFQRAGPAAVGKVAGPRGAGRGRPEQTDQTRSCVPLKVRRAGPGVGTEGEGAPGGRLQGKLTFLVTDSVQRAKRQASTVTPKSSVSLEESGDSDQGGRDVELV